MPEIYTFIDALDDETDILLEHWRLASVDGLGMPDVGHLSSRYAQQDGETYLGTRLKPRIVTLSFQMVYDTESELWDARDELMRIMQYFAHGFHLLIALPNGETRQIDLRFQSGLTLPRDLSQNLTQQVCVMQCIAHEPLLYDPDLNAVLYLGGTVIGTHDVNNAGSWDAFPSLLLEGPWNAPTVQNDETGEILDLSSYNIALWENVTIYLTPGLKTIYSNVSGNILSYLTANSDLMTWHLVSGHQDVTFGGGGETANTRATFNWYDRYIGI